MIIFGAGKLPEIGAGLGKSIWNFKKGVAEVEKEEPEKRLKQLKVPGYFGFTKQFYIG